MRTIQSPVGADIVLDGRPFINFGGSSYLGLSARREILDAGVAALRAGGSGYQFPRNHQVATAPHQAVEAEAAAFFGSETAFYMAGGYFFGLVAVASLRERYSPIYFDELAHFSLREAIAASGCPAHSFRHLDAEDLRTRISRTIRAGQKPLVATDGLFSTLGEIAPLDALADVTASYGGLLLVDESHSFGTLGSQGRGAVEHFGIGGTAVLAGGSTGKALGVLGGLIPATQAQVAAFLTTPAGRGAATGTAASAAMCAKSLRYVKEHPELLRRLRKNTAYLKAGLRSIGLDISDSIAPVATFALGSVEATRRVKEDLLREGIFVFHSTYIGAGLDGVIRCGIFADHTEQHLDSLVESLRRLL